MSEEACEQQSREGEDEDEKQPEGWKGGRRVGCGGGGGWRCGGWGGRGLDRQLEA